MTVYIPDAILSPSGVVDGGATSSLLLVVCGKCNMPKYQAKIDAAHKKWQAVSGPVQADVKPQSKRKKGSVPDTKKQEEVKTESGDDVAPPSTAPEGDSITPAGMYMVMV